MDTLSILRGLVDRYGEPETARLVGVSQPTVWRWMRGKHRISPGMDRLIRLAGDTNEQGAVLETPDQS